MHTKDFPLCFTRGKTGRFTVPARLSRANYALLKIQIEQYLRVIRATAVREK